MIALSLDYAGAVYAETEEVLNLVMKTATGGNGMVKRTTVLNGCLVALAFLTFFMGKASGAAIHIFESRYRVWGHIEEFRYDTTGATLAAYDQLSDTPLTRSISYYNEELYVGSAQSTSTSSDFLVSAAANLAGEFAASAQAEYVCRFQPEFNHAKMVFTYDEGYVWEDSHYYCYGNVRLTDVTSSEVVIESGSFGTGLYGRTADDAWPGEAYYDMLPDSVSSYWESFDVAFDPSHTYELAMTCHAGAVGDYPPVTDIQISANLVIPIPSTLLLGTLGMGIVGWMRRRRTL